MRLTRKEYDELIRRNPRLSQGDNGGPRPIVQKHETLHPGQQDRKAADPDAGQHQETDGAHHKRFSVSIDFRISDNRRRDLDGMLATVMDCLQAARRRLDPMDT